MDRLNETAILEKVVKIVMDQLDQQGLINRQSVLKDKILKKKWITYKEIADANIWDVKSKSGVERVVKTEIDPDCIDNSKHPFRIHRSEVERIAKNRGTL